MSVVNRENHKVLLPRSGPDEFWQTVLESYAHTNSRRWKYLAMLALRETAGWSLDQIALVFPHKPGHISRCLRLIKEELREQFDAEDPEDAEIEEGRNLWWKDGG